MAQGTCSVEGCGRQAESRGVCVPCRKRLVRRGEMEVEQMQVHFPDSLLLRMNPQDDGCILFTGGLTGSGYGQIWKDGRLVGAHVAAYEHFVGPIPEGKHLHHRCETPACVNVDHLEPLTPLEHRRKHLPTHCERGHEFNEVNSRTRPNGARYCHTCKMDRQRDRRRRFGRSDR